MVARQKAAAVASEFPPEQLILAADTMVVLGDRIIGKPKSREEAMEILSALSGTQHVVVTGVVLRRGTEEWSFSDSTRVHFHPLSSDDIRYYVDRYQPFELIEEKKKADAPVATYEGKPVTKGKGRFGPFIKWDGMFINVPKRYDFDHLTKADINELIAAKVEKEANRYIQRWSEENIALENGRWGPFIRFGKKMVKVPRKADDSKYTAEEAAAFSLEEVKKMIELEIPGAFSKKEKKAAPKKAATAKKAAPKKKAAAKKKAAPKKKGK